MRGCGPRSIMASVCIVYVFLLVLAATAQEEAPSLRDVRLVDGTGNFTSSGGRLEIYYFRLDIFLPSDWGTVCSTGFDYHDGDLVCQQLGFQSAYRVGTVRELGFPEAPSSTAILVDHVDCFSFSTEFRDCLFSGNVSCTDHNQDVAVNCTNDPDPVRLVSRSGRTIGTDTGRLEIFINGEWGTVCGGGIFFTKTEADVACRQLGFAMGSVSSTDVYDLEFSLTTGIIWLGDLDCTSARNDANLRTCLRGGRDDFSYCTHEDDVILSCLNEGSLRLVSNLTSFYSNFSSFGRLEVYSGGRWGTVCDNGFTITDANVACVQLGFSSANYWDNIDNSYFVPSAPPSTEILLDGVNCTNDDLTLLSCDHKSIGVHSCTHSQDVALTCETRTPTPPYQSDPIRLISQTGRTNDLTAGRVEVFLKDRWGAVCDNYFGITEASVLCRQLGFPSGAISFSTADKLRVSPASGRVWLDDLNCFPSPNASNWRACNYADIGISFCYGQDIVLSCLKEGSVRLLNGSFNPIANFSSYGRLEVYSGGRWGTVCNDGFSQTNADVVCRQLGFTGADRWSNISSSVRRAPSSRPILLDDVSCSSSDQSLLLCRHSEIGVHDCSHDQDVEVYCSTRLTTATSSKVGAIVGGVVGGVVFIVFCVGIVVCILVVIYFQRRVRGLNLAEEDVGGGDMKLMNS